MKRLPLCKNDTCAQLLLFGTWHHSLIFIRATQRDWSTRCFLTNLIGWLFCDVIGKEALPGFSGQPKSDKYRVLSELYWTPHISAHFVRFCSGKKQCLSQAVYFNISRGYVLTKLPLIKQNIKETIMRGTYYFVSSGWRKSEMVEKQLRRF